MPSRWRLAVALPVLVPLGILAVAADAGRWMERQVKDWLSG